MSGAGPKAGRRPDAGRQPDAGGQPDSGGRPDSDDDSGLRQELLGLLARQARRVPVPVFLAAVLLAAIAAGRVPAWLAGGWLAAVSAVLLLRWRLLGALPSVTRLTVEQRVRIAVALSALNGCVHALSVGFMPRLDDTERALQSILLLGLCAGSVATTAGYLPVFLAFVLPSLVSLASMWALLSIRAGEGWQSLSIAALVALFAMLLTALARDVYRLFRESFDIRRQKDALNRQLQVALEQAQAASRAKTRFLASASHDLRQPMHTLSLFGAALAMRPLDDATRQIAQHMGTALQSLGAQLDALLDISKLDAGVVAVRPGRFSVQRFVQRLAGEFAPAAQAKGLALTGSCPADAVCATDEMLLARIVRNLLDNAVKYTDRGGIAIEVERQDDALQLSVSDTGAGIDAAEQARVFEEFYQIGNPERDRSRGLGLGLSIVRRLADLLGLALRMQSASGRGTRFVLTLPLADADADADADAGAEQPAAEASGASRLDGVDVLVVDDEEAVRQGMKTLLEGFGCRVALARGTGEAEQAARRAAPRIVLADLRLSGDDDGIATVRRLRERDPHLAALLVSGDTAPDRLQQAHAAGIPLLHKPVPAHVLTAAIVAELRRAHRDIADQQET